MHHVFPLAAVLLNSLAFSRAAKPIWLVSRPTDTRTRIQRTIFDQHLFIVDDADILFTQVVNLAVLHFPQFISNLGNQTCGRVLKINRGRKTKHTEIVRYYDNTTFVFLDRPCESIDRGHIQVIGRFICQRTLAGDMLRTLVTAN